MPFGNADGEMGLMMILVRELGPKEEKEMNEIFATHPYYKGWENNDNMDDLFPTDANDAGGWARLVRRDETGDFPELLRSFIPTLGPLGLLFNDKKVMMMKKVRSDQKV